MGGNERYKSVAGSDILYKQDIERVRKDLEVLDILKKHFQYTRLGQWYVDMCEADFNYKSECSEEEWINSPQKKIGEWLRQ